MAGPPAVRVEGAAEFRRAIARMAADLETPDFHRDAGELVRDRALERVPRVSGDLASTIDVVVGADGSELVAGSAAVPYAGVIEYGWPERGIEAQHYLTDDHDPAEVHDVYADQVGELVKRVGRES